MKKLIALILYLVLLLPLVACGEDFTGTTESTVTEPDVPTETVPSEEPTPTETVPPAEITPSEEANAPAEEDVPSDPTPEDEFFLSSLTAEDRMTYESLKLFLEEAQHQNLSFQVRQDMLFQGQTYLGLGDSAAWQERELTETAEGLRIQTGILLETRMEYAAEMNAAQTLAEKIAIQYGYWEETGNLDYVNNDKNTPPYYRVMSLAINGTDTYGKVQVLINGIDFGTWDFDHEVFLLPVESEAITAKEPVVIDLNVLEGELPEEHCIFVYLDSNISGAR